MADTSKISLKQLKDAMNKAKKYTDNEIASVTGVSKVEPEALDMPKVFFYGNALPTTKDNVNLTMEYISNTAKFRSFVKLKCQGTSSMSYAKKNFTVTMFSDEARETKLKKDFKGWGAQSKFCLKANYVDTTHTRNISGARIASDMVQSRPDSPFKQQLVQCPRNGAVDGFPIKLYFNGEFYGIYTWNIPKDGWMFNMDKSNPNHVVLCAERNTDGNASAINSCQFRKLWTDGDGGDWSVEFGTYSTDMVASLNRCINFVMTATDQEFHDNIGEYFDLYSLLDYYCFSYLCCHLDGLAKNMLMVTYDGVIWGACLYDMDSIYGVHWNGNSYVATNYQCPEQYQEQFSALWPRIERCFATELYARYLELRQGALSLSNIIKHVEEIYDVIPDRVFADEKAKWTSLPQVNTNTMTRFRNYMRDRAVYVDAQMQEIGTRVPCTGIVLSADTLSFTTTDTQTVSVVVSPDNCTEAITWSVSPTRIVTVKNGVVTPIRNGEATITATCGSYSDTCAVTVSGISESGGDTGDYTDISYIESTGTQYINTRIVPTASTKIELVAEMSASKQYDHIFGSDNFMKAQWVDGSGTTMYANKKNGQNQITGLTLGKHTYVMDMTDTANVITIDGTKYGNIIGQVESTTYSILLLSGYKTDGTVETDLCGIGKIYSCKIYHEDTLVANMKPILTNSGTYGLLDTVNNTFYASEVGSFTGPVPPSGGDTDTTLLEAVMGSFDSNFSEIASDIRARTAVIPLEITGDSFNFSCSSTTWEFAFKLSDNTGNVSGALNLVTNETLRPDATDAWGIPNFNYSTGWLNTKGGTVLINSSYCKPSYVRMLIRKGPAGDTFNIHEIKDLEFSINGTSYKINKTVPTNNTVFSTAEYAITEPRTFNGASDYIDTGIKLFDTAKTFTIFVDYASTTAYATPAVAFHCVHEVSPWRGLCLMKVANSDTYFIGGQAGGQNSYATNMPGNGKYLISFVNGVINEIVTVDNSGNLVHSATDIGANNPYVQISENLLIGCYQDTSGTKGRFWSGTINKFGVWYKQLTEAEINQVFGKSGGDSGENTNLVFQVNSASMNTADNTLTDNIAGISATLTGNPTVSNNNVMFTASDYFVFDISSLDLTNSDMTVRIKLTQDSLTSTPKNILTVGSSNSQECWNVSNTVYSVNNGYRFQYGKVNGSANNNNISDYTIGNFNGPSGSNFAKAQVNIEQEIVMSINKNTKDIRIFIDGELVQDGKISIINNPLYLGNHEGSNRFVGGYSLIEIYNGYCNDYTEFTNMVNNASSGGESGENTNYLANASWQAGTLDITNNATVSGSIDTGSSDDRYASVQIPAGKYALRSSNATWKKFRLSDSKGTVLYYYAGENTSYDVFIDTTISDDTIFTLEVSYYRPNDTIEVPSLMITDRTNITTVTLDGSLTYGIPVWDTNPSGQNGQVNVEHMISGLTSTPMYYKLEGYTYNNGLNNAESIGLTKQYNLGYWNGSIYLRFTLDMAETGVTNDVESVTNYLSNHPLTFKYVR